LELFGSCPLNDSARDDDLSHIEVVLPCGEIMIRSLFLLLIFFSLGVQAAEQEWTRPPHIDEGIWEIVKPFLIPKEHPLKKKLDKIFQKADFRITQNTESLKRAGFRSATKDNHYSGAEVLMHNGLKSHIIKLYTDESCEPNATGRLLARILGAHFANLAIINHNQQKNYAVPRKWLYPIPESPPAPFGTLPKQFLLVAEKLSLADKNSSWWRNSASPLFLNTFWIIITEAGLSDCTNISNSPRTKDGRIGFIDTEVYHAWPVLYHRLLRYLTGSNYNHWHLLMEKGGP
jgi:hypothetical protein